MRLRHAATAALAAALLAGCTAASTPTEVVTVTVAADPIDAAPDPDVVNALAIQLVWDEQSPSDRADICLGWGIDPDQMLDAFMEGWGDDLPPDESQVRQFFNGECA